MKKIFYISVITLVLAAVGLGLYLSGSPQEQRLKKFDQRRVQDLQQIVYEVESYYRVNEELPDSLNKLDVGSTSLILKDPKTSESYRYEVLNSQEYQLCAEFEISSDGEAYRPIRPEFDWSHPDGEYCFKRDVKDVKLENNSPRVSPKPVPEG